MRNELLAIAGIASAELEGAEDAPQGVRVQLAAGADAELVGREVERVLATHGMRSHRAPVETPATPQMPATAPPLAADLGPPPPPGAGAVGAAVVPMPGMEQQPAVPTGAVPQSLPQLPAVTQPAVPQPAVPQGTVPTEPYPPQPPEVLAGSEPPVQPRVSVEPAPPQRLESISIEEGREGIAVRVAAGDATASRHVGRGSGGMDVAVVGAVSDLLGVEAELIEVQRSEASETRIVTVLIDVTGLGRRVGSALIGAGEAFSVAQAVWSALRAPD